MLFKSFGNNQRIMEMLMGSIVIPVFKHQPPLSVQCLMINVTYTVVLNEGHPGEEDDWRLQDAILVSGGTVQDDTDNDEYVDSGDNVCGL